MSQIFQILHLVEKVLCPLLPLEARYFQAWGQVHGAKYKYNLFIYLSYIEYTNNLNSTKKQQKNNEFK